MFYRKHPGLAEDVAEPGDPLLRHRRQHPVDHEIDVITGARTVFLRDVVRAEEGRHHGRRAVQLADRGQLLDLGLEGQPVSRLHLHRGAAVCQQNREPGTCQLHEVAPRAPLEVTYRSEDAASALRYRLVVSPLRTKLMLHQARGTEQRVGVGIDEPRKENAVDLLDSSAPGVSPHLAVGSHRPDSSVTGNEHGPLGNNLQLRHFWPATRSGGTAAGDDLRGAHQESAQSCASCIGSLRPCVRAAAMASGYPASAWRITPMPGSLFRTRSSRIAARSVPSATMT